MAEAQPIQPPSEDRANSPGAGADALADTMNCAQYRRMWRAVVNENDGSGESERTREDLNKEHGCDADPDKHAVCLVRWLRAGRYLRQEWNEGVGEREEEKSEA
ncbi:hypothetical protein LTR16_012390, partial [Cryomyces antarcticus]